MKHFMALAGQCDAAGLLPLTVTLSLSAAELLGLARLAREEKITMPKAFATLFDSDNRGAMELRNFLANFET